MRAAAQVSERAQALEQLAFRLYLAIYSPAWHLAAPEKVDVEQQDLLHYQALTCIFLQVYVYLHIMCVYIYAIDFEQQDLLHYQALTCIFLQVYR